MKKISAPVLMALVLLAILLSAWRVSPAIAADQALVPSIVVKLKPGLSAAEQSAVIARHGGIQSSSIPALRMYVIAIPDGGDAGLILQKYQSDPQVERAEPNKARQAEAQPNDDMYAAQWAMPKIGWESVFGSIIPLGNAVVALLDTGVYANHPDLGENLVLPGISILDGNSDGRTDPNGHGTWLAGVIAAVTDNGEGVAGICTSGVKILPVTVLNPDGIGSDGDIISGIVWAADQGADVILMGFSNTDFSQSLQEAIDYAWGKGAVLVAATGNAGVATPTFPAGNRGVIGVSATNQEDLLATGSNYGQAVFLAAPGKDIPTTNIDSRNPYISISGTSASSAVVAGVAAFMRAADSTLTNGVIVGRLATSADAIGLLGDPNSIAMFGNGRVNIANALASRDTNPVQPAGAAPVGGGGPYVGTYAIASGFDVDASFSANTSTISAHGEGINYHWIYQYAYKSPDGTITYHPCMSGSEAGSDSKILSSGFPTGIWHVYLYAYNPSYTTCLNNGTATKTATIATEVNVTNPYMTVASATGSYGGRVTLSAALTIGIPLSGKTITFTLNGGYAGSAVTDGSGVATMYNAELGTVSAGSYPTGIGAGFAGDGVYTASSAVGSLTVVRAIPTVTAWPTAGAITYGQSLSESALSGGSASAPGTFAFSAPAMVPNAGSYIAAVVFIPENPNYETVTGNVSIMVNRLIPIVTAWPTAGAITYGQVLSASKLSGGSASVAGSFSFATPTTLPNAGSYRAALTFTPDDANYAAVNGSIDVTVDRAASSISAWPAAGAITYGQPLSASVLSGGSASVAGSFSFAAPSTVPNAGSYSAALTFTPDDANYTGVNGSVEITVNRAAPTVTAWPAAGAITYGQPLSASVLSGGSASVAGSFSFALPATLPDAGSYAAAVTFTPDDANYDRVSGNVPVTVNKLIPAIASWPTAGAITYGEALSASILSGGSASVAGSFSFAMPSIVPDAGSYNGALTFTPDDANYAAVNGNVSVTVNKAYPGISAWPAASPITYGQALSASILSGGNASVAGGFSFATPEALLNAGEHSVVVTFTPGDASNYLNASGNVNINVAPASQSISFGALSNVGFGVEPFTVSATATSGLPVSFSSLTATVCSVSGGTVTFVGVGTCTIEASQPGGLNYYSANPVAQSFTVSPGELDHFSISAVSSPQVAGTPFGITIIAQDTWNNTVTSFTGTVDLGTTAGTITPAVTQPFVDGVWSGTVMVTATGTGKTVTVTANAKTGEGNSFDVNPGAAAAFTVSAPPITAAGVPFDITVTAKDAYDNTASGYTGTVHFSSTDPKAGIVIPADYSFLPEDSGTRIFTGIVLETAAVQTITAADMTAASINGTSGSIAVSPAEAAKLSITAPATATAGTAFNLTVAVKDAFDNDIVGYTGTVGFTSSDPQAVLPVNYIFVPEDNGSHTFVAGVNLRSSGTHTIAAADLLTPGMIGTSGSIAVSPAAANTLVFSQQPMDSAPGTPITPFVALSFMDQYGNVATGSTADVTLELAAGSHSGILMGATTRNAVNGVATFADLAIGAEGHGYMLTATAVGLPPVNSALFDIIIGSCGKPASLNVPATNDTGTIVISWSESDVSGATYILEQSKDGGAYSAVYSGTGISAEIAVTASGTYTYRVKAMKDGYIASDYTVSGSCQVRLTAGKPALLTVPASSRNGTLALTWGASDVSGATYILEQSKDGGVYTEVYRGTGISVKISLPDNGTYTYRVKAAKEGYFASDYTAGSNGCVAQLACGQPVSLTVPAANSTGMISIRWGLSETLGATYILEQSKDGGAYSVVYSGTNSVTSIIVAANGTYSYRVKATKVNYDPSDYTYGSGCLVHLACGEPASLTVPVANTTGIITISWGVSDVSGATFVLEQSRDGGAYTVVYSGTNRSAAVSVTANGSYSYRVKATKSNYDDSDYTAGTVCEVHLICGSPSSLTVPATNSTGMIAIKWGVSDVSGSTYILEQSRDGGAYTEVYRGTSTLASIAVTANGTYSYRVKAVKANYDDSGYADGAGCVVYLVCGKSASLTVPATNSTGVIPIKWGASDVSGATYILEQSRDGSAYIEVYSGTSTLASIAVTANGNYSYRVKVTKANYVSSGYTDGTGCAVYLACGKPASLTVPANNSTGIIAVNWGASDVSGATYILEQSRDGGAYIEVYNGTSTLASIAVTANGTYSYRVKATKADYVSSSYTEGTGCVVYLACGKPASLTVPATSSTGMIFIRWGGSDVGGATYVLEQSRDGGAYTEVYSGTSTTASIAVTFNGTYSYRVKATKADYVSSDYTGGTGCVVYLVCSKPASLSVPASNSTGMITVSWGPSDVSGVTYVLEQSKDGWGYTEVYSGTNRSAAINITANGTYSYRVKATKANYISSDYTVGPGCVVYLACGKPASLNVPATSSTGMITIGWGSSDVTGPTYILEQSKDGGEYTVVYSGPNRTAVISVTAGGTYSYRLKAQKAGYIDSDWVTGGLSTCVVSINSKIRIKVTGQPDIFFPTISDAFSGMPLGTTAVLNTLETAFTENVNFDRLDSVLTIGAAYDPSYATRIGPVVIQGVVAVTRGTLVVDSLVIR